MFQLPSPIEFLHETTRFAPIGLYLDVEFEKDFCSQHTLELQTRRGANPLEHLSLFPDQDALLAFALAVNGCGNTGKPGALFKGVNDHGGCVRQFFLSLDQHTLANDFRSHEACRLVGDLIRREIWWARW